MEAHRKPSSVIGWSSPNTRCCNSVTPEGTRAARKRDACIATLMTALFTIRADRTPVSGNRGSGRRRYIQLIIIQQKGMKSNGLQGNRWSQRSCEPKHARLKITNIASFTSHVESRTKGHESMPSPMMGEAGMQEGKQGVGGRAVEGRYGQSTLYMCMKTQQNSYLVHLHTQVIVIFGVPNWRDPKTELLCNCIYILKNVIVLLVCIFTVCRGTFWASSYNPSSSHSPSSLSFPCTYVMDIHELADSNSSLSF